MSKYFITGLCMQGNKGGPALAISLVEAIKKYIPDAEFVFEVPDIEEEWRHELVWAKKYGFNIVKRIGLKNILFPYNCKLGRFKQFITWWRTLKSSDVLIQMSAICYVGPPSARGDIYSMLSSSRVHHFFLSGAARRPMLAWTQSYGPLSTKSVRFFAKMDLRKQPIIFCRGDDCRNSVKNLLPHVKVLSFPDVAIALPFDQVWGKQYIQKKFLYSRPVVTVSPSAVIYSRCANDGEENKHIIQVRKICKELYKHGFDILLVPHTYRPSRHSPRVCDYAVAKVIYDIENNSNISLVEDDLSPSELKSIISNASFHIGARYHSIVAALSSGVPSVSLSWHPKYRDLMRSYGLEKYVIDEMDIDKVENMINAIVVNYEDLKGGVVSKDYEIKTLVDANAQLFVTLLKKVSK